MSWLYSKEFVAALMAVMATSTVVYLAVLREDAALGALIATSAASVAWFLRGRTQEPTP